MKSKKKKKKRKKRGGLRRKANQGDETGSAYDDDKTSFMTMTVADQKEQEDFMLSLIDDVKLVQKPREFRATLPIIESLGIDNYDSVMSMNKLVFTMREAL